MMITDKLKDPIIRGGTAGVIGGAVMMAIDSILYSLGYLKLRAPDFIMVLIKHEKATNTLEFLSGTAGHLLNAGISGVILLLILEVTDYRSPIIKGAGLGLSVNFTFFYMASFFKLTTITKNPITSIVILHITATVYGVVMGYLLYYFYQRWGPVLE